MKKFFLIPFFALLTLFTGTGCDLDKAIQEMEESLNPTDPEYVISVHRIVRYRRGDQLERDIDTFSGGVVCVNVNPFLHTRNIKKIDLAVRDGDPGFFDLVLHLDKRGQMLWSSIAVQYRGEKLGLVIDGVYYRAFMPKIPNPDDIDEKTGSVTVILEGPIDQATAHGIAKFSEKNYRYFNR